jgi:hypothetical protein
MIDNMNPTISFHPYQPAGAIPHSEQPENGVAGIVEKAGLDPEKFRNFAERMKSRNARDWLDLARSHARNRPALVLGTLAIAAITAGLFLRRQAP